MRNALSLPPRLALALAALAPGAAGQALVLGIDGGAPGEALGAAVAALGDFDGDLVPDVLVGAPGHPTAKLQVRSGADGALLASFTGLDPGDDFGQSVAAPGDLDGDGVPDVAACSRSGGYARALSGASGAVLLRASGTSWLVAGPGDLDGDGTPDLAVGAPGEVRAYSGATGALLYTVTGHTSFGRSLAAPGDVDLDGRPDLLVGAWFEDSGGAESGGMYVLSGPDGALIHAIPGPGEYHWFGEEVAGLGDVDGDGWPDVAAHARIEQLFIFVTPYTQVHSGKDGSLLLHVETTWSDELVNGVIARAGDADGDGSRDFLAGGRRWNGGHDLGLYSGRDGTELWHLDVGHSAKALDLAGDVDGDGILEFVLGHAAAAPSGADSGRVELRRVDCLPPAVRYCIGAPNSVGPGATLSFHGPRSIAADAFALDVSGAVPLSFGVFYYGPTAIQVPFGDGFRCVGGGATGTFRLNPPLPTDADGAVSRPLDFTAPPAGAGPGAIAPGVTWHFQYWYRDVPAGLSGFNLTDALAIAFCP